MKMLMLLFMASIIPQSYEEIVWNASEPKILLSITEGNEDVLVISRRNNKIIISGRQKAVAWVFEQWQERTWPGFKNDPNWHKHCKKKYDEYAKSDVIMIHDTIDNRNALMYFLKETL